MAGEVKAEVTGTVWKILLKVGDAVEEEDEIMILESMKMEMPVEAPVDGTIAQILVEEGQSIKEGDLLAVIDEG